MCCTESCTLSILLHNDIKQFALVVQASVLRVQHMNSTSVQQCDAKYFMLEAHWATGSSTRFCIAGTGYTD